ncbi:MAG: SOS response-associated peptidase [Caldicoprobacter oshimai]|uniref:Abasic site processing protein n=1 Tax=Caldicoprobacter faecalis TaxID=937334 RepID=A0A1I5SXI0_9FIRM|nr:SOS response-associated peptidase [Caldicoprobacter faecalis]SFP75453.1 Putative SOS response-associated peptidase YedK [Caldicoprobacter faecalis]
MCVRFLLKTGIEELVRNYRVESVDEGANAYRAGDFYPAQSVPVVLEQKSRVITLARWGFNYSSKKKVVVNARAETILDRPMFKDAARYARCIVPANLFYEWKAEGIGKKVRYRIGLQDASIMSLGGLYKLSFDKDLGPQLAFVIITTDAEEGVREVHPRMPLIIKEEWVDMWLNKDTPVELVEEILSAKTGAKFTVERCEDAINNKIKEGMYGEQMKMF